MLAPGAGCRGGAVFYWFLLSIIVFLFSFPHTGRQLGMTEILWTRPLNLVQT